MVESSHSWWTARTSTERGVSFWFKALESSMAAGSRRPAPSMRVFVSRSEVQWLLDRKV